MMCTIGTELLSSTVLPPCEDVRCTSLCFMKPHDPSAEGVLSTLKRRGRAAPVGRLCASTFDRRFTYLLEDFVRFQFLQRALFCKPILKHPLRPKGCVLPGLKYQTSFSKHSSILKHGRSQQSDPALFWKTISFGSLPKAHGISRIHRPID